MDPHCTVLADKNRWICEVQQGEWTWGAFNGCTGHPHISIWFLVSVLKIIVHRPKNKLNCDIWTTPAISAITGIRGRWSIAAFGYDDRTRFNDVNHCADQWNLNTYNIYIYKNIDKYFHLSQDSYILFWHRYVITLDIYHINTSVLGTINLIL